MGHRHGHHDDRAGPREPPPGRAGKMVDGPDAAFTPGRWSRARGPHPVPAGRPVQRLLTGIVVILAMAHLVGMALLWPRGPAPIDANATDVYAGVTFAQGDILHVTHTTCAGDTDDRLADGSVPATMTCTTASVHVVTGPDTGRVVNVGIPAQVDKSGIDVGVAVQLIRYPAQAGAASVYAFLDFARELPLALLAICFAALVVVVARWRGLAALAGLVLAYVTIAVFVLPALRHGEDPLMVAAVGAGSIMMVILYLAHGFSAKTSTALLGTLVGIWLSAGLADWVSGAAHLNGLETEESFTLSRLTTGGDLHGVVLAGIVLAGLGVLNDVTITQASAVRELAEHAPHLGSRGLFTSGMRIGRDHLASTVYTIAFAYAGVALPTLLLVDVTGEPLRQLLSSNEVGEEIARTLVASIGLVLSIPLTTAIAVLVARGSGHPRPDRSAVEVAAPIGCEPAFLPSPGGVHHHGAGGVVHPLEHPVEASSSVGPDGRGPKPTGRRARR